MINYISNIDTQLLFWLNSFHSAFFDEVMWLTTGKWIWIPFYISILYVLVKQQNYKMVIVYVIAIVCVIILSDQFCASVLRPYFHRLRPSNIGSGISSQLHLVKGYRGGTYGLPSCHAANSFGLSIFMIFLFKNRRLSIFMFLWAILLSYSRIYTGVHYPLDIIAGAIVGLVASGIIFFIMGKIIKLNILKKTEYKQVFHFWDDSSIYPIITTGIATIMAIAIYSACI